MSAPQHEVSGAGAPEDGTPTFVPETETYREPDTNVRQISEGPADYDLDAQQPKRIRPYRLKCDGRWWTVEQPDIGTIMAAEQAPTAEAFMELMFEEQWDDLAPVFKRHPDPQAMWDIARGISIHFDLDSAARPRNRRDRRHPTDREAPRRR